MNSGVSGLPGLEALIRFAEEEEEVVSGLGLAPRISPLKSEASPDEESTPESPVFVQPWRLLPYLPAPWCEVRHRLGLGANRRPTSTLALPVTGSKPIH